MLVDFALVMIGLAGLFVGGESLVKGAARLASALGVPPLIVGLTVVALGTSMPELLVSLNAALGGASDIALGNVLGSNIANIGLILGISGLIFPLTVEWRLIRQEIPLMIIVSVALMLMSLDGEIGRGDGMILVIGFAAFNLFSILSALQSRRQITPELSEFVEEEQLTPLKADVQLGREVVRVAFGVLLLAVGANWTVEGATGIARAVGISEIVIGLTLIALGTSLPELVASVIASMRREADIIAGNVVGSNLANILAILGLTSVVQPITVQPALLGFEYPVMIIFALVLVLFLLRQRLNRITAFVLLISYALFIIITMVK